MEQKISKELNKRLKQEKIAWLTTVRSDGTPQPAPVWFLWDGESFLIYSQPAARKIRNIRNNPRVAINLNSDRNGSEVAVLWGNARLDPDPPNALLVKEYLEKYRQGISDIGLTPESMAREYSTAIHVKPDRVRED